MELSGLFRLFVKSLHVILSLQNKGIIKFFVVNNSKAEAALEVSTTTKYMT